MKVGELRETIKKYSLEEMNELVVELYKNMPKALKEEREIDDIIISLQSRKEQKKVKKDPNELNLMELEVEIEDFLANAYAQNYMRPNRIISKKDRPKWRFVIKRYIKQLTAIPPKGEKGCAANELLWKIYEMLSYGCRYYIFSTNDPFESIKMDQGEFFGMLISRTVSYGTNEHMLKRAIALAVKGDLSSSTIDFELISGLVNGLVDQNDIHTVIEIANKKITEDTTQLKISVKKNKYWDRRYEFEERINNLVELVFISSLKLNMMDEGVLYFNNNYISNNKEATLYEILELLFLFDLHEEWINVYEAAVKKKIKPREILINVYKYIKKHNAMPESYRDCSPYRG